MKITDILDYELYFRTLVITLYALYLFRTSSSRLLGQYSPLDLIITIVIGAVLGSAIAGGLPLLSSMVSTGFIVIIHRTLILISVKNTWFGNFIRGKKAMIINDGKFIRDNLEKSKLTPDDVLQALRSQQGKVSIKNVARSFIEVDGTISFIMNE